MKFRHYITLIFIMFVASSCAKTPTIVVSPESINLRTLSPGESVEDTFWVKNTGEGVLSAEARSGCDCIELENELPDAIAPGDSFPLAFVYYAPDSAVVEKKSIFISSNDEKNKVKKLSITATVRNKKLARGDSTITFIPFASKETQLKNVSDNIMRTFFSEVNSKLHFHPVNPSKIIQDIISDHNYGKKPISEIIRKWSLMDSVRWVVACQLSLGRDSSVIGKCSVVDGFSEFPMEFSFRTAIPKAGSVFMDSLVAFFGDIGNRYRNAMMKGMQIKWAMQRKEVMNKPLPKMQFVDVRTGDTLTEKAAKGKILLLHFFGIDCEHCEEEVKWLTDLANTHPENLIIWGVSIDMDKPDSVEIFARQHKLPYPIVLPTSESHRRLTRIYGGATPQTIVADKDGIVREFFVGFNRVFIQRLESLLSSLTNGTSSKNTGAEK